ncbi:Protein argonaute 16 [Carex littledalei]|uniref:Protein argonaute 16 n=1 Tax=Carex littledalei TaxID=544730 RepID=A0A833VDX7_9POAL|nr:Protein argonaute 16 [Carex littledalei]
MTKPAMGIEDSLIHLLSNHINVNFIVTDVVLYQHMDVVNYKNNKAVDYNQIRWKVMEKLVEIYNSEIEGKKFGYDSGQSLFIAEPLSRDSFNLNVVLEKALNEPSYLNAKISPKYTAMNLEGFNAFHT